MFVKWKTCITILLIVQDEEGVFQVTLCLPTLIACSMLNGWGRPGPFYHVTQCLPRQTEWGRGPRLKVHISSTLSLS